MKFRNFSLIGASLVVLALLPAASVMADSVVLTQNAYSFGVGGEFTATTSGNGIFNTFCLEYSEDFYPGKTYQYGISDRAVSGGAGGTPTGDVISQGTAWLYTQFAQGTLANYFSSTATIQKQHAGQLQLAIWWLEDEQPDPGSTNPYRNAVLQAFSNPKEDYTGSEVAVMNITDPTRADGLPTILRQDQLIYLGVPDGGSTLALLGIALAGMAFFPIRFRRS